jgi:iron(III) transport system ATP-binding protein
MFLQLINLQVQYPKQTYPAVDAVSLQLEAGQMGVLIGPSGCGKTTLLRAIAGLEPITQGSIELAGQRVSDTQFRQAPEQRRVGMVFQDYALFPHLNIEHNIAFGLHGWTKSARINRIAEVLKLVGLLDARKKYPHELSGGQQQRVALARALAPKPDLLLLDEPFSNLDVNLRERLALEVRNILKEANTTALFVTHDQLEAFAVGDLIGVMNQGRLLQWDSSYNLYHQPSTPFVASFIGEGVLIPGHVVATAQGMQVETELGPLHQHDPLVNAEITGRNLEEGLCEVLIRADDVVVDDGPALHVGQLESKAFRGAQFIYSIRLTSGTTLLSIVPSHREHKVGDTLGFNIKLDHLITFASRHR